MFQARRRREAEPPLPAYPEPFPGDKVCLYLPGGVQNSPERGVVKKPKKTHFWKVSRIRMLLLPDPEKFLCSEKLWGAGRNAPCQ